MIDHKSQSDGFTIIELLIATIFFTVLLMVLTLSIIRINNTYFKDLTETQTQNVARAITDSIAHDIQFGAGSVSVPTPLDYQASSSFPAGTADTTGYAICTQGRTTRYSVMIGRELKDNPTGNQVKNAVVVDHPAGGCTAGAGGALPVVGGTFDMSAATNPTELLSPNMRVAYLTVNQPTAGNIYVIRVRVVYGDDDLLYDNFALGNWNPDGTLNNTNNVEKQPATDGILDQCKVDAGSQFCNVAYLATYVQKRVQ